jgi:hypothetical protein
MTISKLAICASASASAVLAFWIAASASTWSLEDKAHALPGGWGNGLMVAGGDGLTGTTYPPNGRGR